MRGGWKLTPSEWWLVKALKSHLLLRTSCYNSEGWRFADRSLGWRTLLWDQHWRDAIFHLKWAQLNPNQRVMSAPGLKRGVHFKAEFCSSPTWGTISRGLNGNISEGLHTGQVQGLLNHLAKWRRSPFEEAQLTLPQTKESITLIKGPKTPGGICPEIQSCQCSGVEKSSIQSAHDFQLQLLI